MSSAALTSTTHTRRTSTESRRRRVQSQKKNHVGPRDKLDGHLSMGLSSRGREGSALGPLCLWADPVASPCHVLVAAAATFQTTARAFPMQPSSTSWSSGWVWIASLTLRRRLVPRVRDSCNFCATGGTRWPDGVEGVTES